MTLELDGLTHRYGGETAVDDVSLGLESGELLALLGPSGCGKTTIVQAIAGHVRPTDGRVLLRGADVTDAPPESRRVGLVFQRSTLYPHMTVGENVAYGLAAREISPDRRDELVAEYLELVGLDDARSASPAALSGGQRRRVELARALAPQPDVLLLDEPLSALDRSLRDRLREEIARVQRETGVTTLFVTHDQRDAMALADRLAVMRDGRIEATGQPRALYDDPPTRFVASFLGRSNALSAAVLGRDPLRVSVCGAEIALPAARVDAAAGTRLVCHVRPEDLEIRPTDADRPGPSVSGEIVDVTDAGRRYDVTVRTATGEELSVERPEPPPAAGRTVSVRLPPEAVTAFRADGE